MSNNILQIPFTLKSLIKLYTKENALKQLKVLEQRKISLMGIDGFYILEKGIQPTLENSIDFTSLENQKLYIRDALIYSTANKFINEAPDDIYFELVYKLSSEEISWLKLNAIKEWRKNNPDASEEDIDNINIKFIAALEKMKKALGY